MDLQLKDKVIIVSGGARGIGEGIVRVLAAEGALPVIIGRNANDNLKLCKELASDKVKIFHVVAELNNPDESEKALWPILRNYYRNFTTECIRRCYSIN